MKISIDLDIEASEIPLATELLNTLRSLTDHIRVRKQPDSGSVPNGEVHYSQSQNGPQPEGPASAPTSQSAPARAAAQEQARPPEQEERLQQLVTYIRSAANDFDTVSRNLDNALSSGDPDVQSLFIDAFSEVALDPKYLSVTDQPDHELLAEHNLYMSLLGELAPDIKERLNNPLVKVMIGDMVSKKSAPRTALMLPAMVYAHLVLHDIVNVKATLRMVERFLKNPGHEAVGLTMLGKTAEICVDKVLQHASPAHLTSLTVALDQLDQRYGYDIEYLNNYIKWKDPCFRVLSCRQKLHSQPVSALAYDPEGKQLISASRDGMVIVWDEWANPIQQHQLPNCYAIAMAFLGDQAPGERVVIIAGQPMTGSKGSACIAAIGLDSPYDLKGPWIRQSTTGMSSVVVLPGHQQFATGEVQTRPEDGEKVHATFVFDCASLQRPDSAELQPTATLVSPSGQVLCLTGYGQSKQVILVGTSGGQVALWAIHNPSAPVKEFAMPDNPGRVLALHFDGADSILAGTSTGTIVQWSVKGMAGIGKTDPLPYVQTMNPDQQPVLKLQFWPNKRHGTQAAIITAHGCWIVNFSSSPLEAYAHAEQHLYAAEVRHVQDVHNDDCSFSAAAWAGEYPYLYTGGQSQKVYVCQLVPARLA